jgi:hypothetical protein
MARPAVQTSSDAPSDLIERGDELSVLSGHHVRVDR